MSWQGQWQLVLEMSAVLIKIHVVPYVITVKQVCNQTTLCPHWNFANLSYFQTKNRKVKQKKTNQNSFAPNLAITPIHVVLSLILFHILFISLPDTDWRFKKLKLFFLLIKTCWRKCFMHFRVGERCGLSHYLFLRCLSASYPFTFLHHVVTAV